MKRPNHELHRGRPREFDTAQALERAMRVFWQKGYLGTSLTDLTEAMGISRPSLYAAFGNKESLFRRALQRYSEGPGGHFRAALEAPTARQVAERMLLGVVEMAACPRNPRGCLWVQGMLSCGDADDPLRRELIAGRASAERALRKRFERAVKEGDLPSSADPAALARYIDTVNFGLAIQAASGASRAELVRVVETAMKAWPGE
jgi:AcrR family transcriptional regulator